MILPLLLQVTPVAPIVKGTALPPPGTEEAAVMAPVQTILGAIPTRDRAAIEAQLMPGGSATVASEKPDGTRQVRRLSWADWLGAFKPGNDRIAETQGMPAVEIDGDIAMVWAPYTFTVNGRPQHCGYNHFDLVRDAGRWRVANITWSSRTTGCTAQ